MAPSRIGLLADVKITKIKGDPNNAYGNRFLQRLMPMGCM